MCKKGNHDRVRGALWFPAQACSVDLGGRDHSSLSRYRFVARQIRGFSFIAPTETLDTLAILKGQTAKTRITLDHEGKNTKQTQFRTTHW